MRSTIHVGVARRCRRSTHVRAEAPRKGPIPVGARSRGQPLNPSAANTPLPPEKLKPVIPENIHEYLTSSKNVVRGVHLDEIVTSTAHLSLNIDRADYCRSFDGQLSERYAGIEVTVTNDYWESEEWCRARRRQASTIIGTCLHHIYLAGAPALPVLKKRGEKRYRDENQPSDGVAALNPGGALRLRSDGSRIGLMALAAERHVLLLQLRQMEVVGPELRGLLENPFVRKGGPYLVEMRRFLREDGIQMIGSDDILTFFLRCFEDVHEKEKARQVFQKAGYRTFLHSISKSPSIQFQPRKKISLAGVELEDEIESIPAYLWGEPDLPEDLVMLSAKQAWSCWASMRIMQLTNPATVPRLSGIGQRML